jgi:hypothetical protein
VKQVYHDIDSSRSSLNPRGPDCGDGEMDSTAMRRRRRLPMFISTVLLTEVSP